ncbi:MAG TPA: hypothetical protein VIU62_15130 [Chloroflexota bacterium]
MAARRRRNPSLRAIGRAITAPARAHRRLTEWSTGYRATMARPPAKAAGKAPDARKEAHEETMRRLRETKEMRAASILWHRAELLKAQAEAARARAERAKSGEVRRSNTSKAETAEKKAEEFARMTKDAEAGKLTGDQLRYYINEYSRNGKKRSTR